MVELIIFGSVSLLLVLVIYPAILYLKYGFGKWFYHDTLKWHLPSGEYHGSNQFVCKHCGKIISREEKQERIKK